MKSNMQYVILIFFIFALQMIFYTNFRQYESSQTFDQATLNYLKKQNEQLQVQISSLETQQPRLPASLPQTRKYNRGEPIDMSEYYFSKAVQLRKNNQIEEALIFLTKVIENSLAVENVTKATFLKIQYKCINKMDDSCLVDIDYLVTQHPESQWTGMSLRLLSNYYEKNRQFAESKSLNDILRKNFSKLTDKQGNIL